MVTGSTLFAVKARKYRIESNDSQDRIESNASKVGNWNQMFLVLQGHSYYNL